MARSTAKSLASVLTAGGCLLLLLVLAGGGSVLGVRAYRIRDNVRFYNEMAAEHASRSYQRAPDPPGWSLQPGVAKQDYQTAWELMERDVASVGHVDTRLFAARTALQPAGWRIGSAIEMHDAPPGPVPTECLDVGFPDRIEDPVIAQLSPGLCLSLVEAGPALEALRAGSRREGSLGPLDIWDRWTAPQIGQLRSIRQVLYLVDLALLEAYLHGVDGRQEQQIRNLACLLRFTQDLARGADQIGAVFGTVQQDKVLSVLHALMLDPGFDPGFDPWFDPALAAVVRDELIYADGHAPDMMAAVQGDTLGMLFLYLPPDRIDWPPGGVSIDPTTIDPAERLVAPAVLHDLRPQIERMLEAQQGTYPDRVAAYRADEALMLDAHGLAQISALTPGHYDAMITLNQAHLRLLALAAADLAFQHDHGHAPSSLDDLTADTPGLATTDPLTDEPFRLENVDGRRSIAALTLDGDWITRLDLTDLDQDQPLANRLRFGLRDLSPTPDEED